MDHGRHTYLIFRNILIYVVLLWSGMTVNAQSGKEALPDVLLIRIRSSRWGMRRYVY